MNQHEANGASSASPRGHVYGFLRRVLLQEVDEGFLGWLRQQEQAGLWSELGISLNGALGGGDDAKLIEDLAVEYCRLFIAERPAGSPHESVHVGSPGSAQKPLLWGDAASSVKDLYREAGFEISEDAHQLPDALSVELEFMERLCHQEAEAEDRHDTGAVQHSQSLQRQMLLTHVAAWVPAYARRLEEAASTEFYCEMLGLLADFTEWETEKLKEL